MMVQSISVSKTKSEVDFDFITPKTVIVKRRILFQHKNWLKNPEIGALRLVAQQQFDGLIQESNYISKISW